MNVREIKTHDELRAVEALQKEVWGCNDLEIVPAVHMIAAQHVGRFSSARLMARI